MPEGRVGLGTARVERRGRASVVLLRNTGAPIAEDDTTAGAAAIAADLATHDPATEVAVVRGGGIEHPKRRDARVLGSAGSMGGRDQTIGLAQRHV